MKKILFVIDKMVMGGAEKILIDIVNNLPKEKYEITVFSLFDGGELKRKFNNDIKFYSWFKKQPKGIYRIIRYFDPKKIYKRYITDTFDFEISFKTGMPEKIVAASPNNKSKKIAWIHGDMEYQNYGFESHRTKQKQNECYSKFNSIVFVSEKCKDSFKRTVGDFNYFKVVYNGVDIENVQILSMEQKDVIYSTEKVIFSTIARLNYEKGVDRIILAAEKLVHESITNFEVYIIGDGYLKQKLENLIKDKKLEKYIIFLGGKKNPYKYLSGSDGFILASRSEAFGLSIIESMALNLPIICTNCGGPKEIVGDSEFGILVDNSLDGIYDGMKKFIQNKSLLKEMYSKKCIQRGKDFSIETMISNIEELFGNVN